MNKYIRVEKMKNLTIDYNALVLLYAVPDDEKNAVIHAVMEFADAVRVENPENVPDKPDLSPIASACYDSFCESIEFGAQKYWEKVEVNRKNAAKKAKG